MAETSVKVVFLGDAKQLRSAVGEVDDATGALDSKFGGLGGGVAKLGAAIGGAFAAKKIIDFGAGAAEAASDYSESANAVEQVFKGSSAAIKGWADQNANSFGLTRSAFQQMSVPLGAMLSNTGIGLDETADLTIALTERAADMASMFNTDVDEALASIQAGLRGQADPLEKYGVGLSAAKVEAEALAATGKKSASQLTDQEKAMARINVIMRETSATQGDFTRNSGEMANAQRIAAARTEELRARIGQQLVPVIERLTQVKLWLVEMIATRVLPALQQFGQWIQANIVPRIEEVVAWVQANWPAFAETVERVMARVQAGVAVALDWINVNVVPTVQQVFALVREIVETALAAIEAFWRTWGGTITRYLEGLWNGVRQVIEGALTVIRGVIETVLALIRGDWSAAWDGIRTLLSGVWQIINGIIDAAMATVRAAIEAGMRLVAGAFDAAWDAIVSAARGFARTIAGVIDEVVSFLAALPGRALSALGNLATLLVGAGRAMIQGLWDGITAVWNEVYGWLFALGTRAKEAIGDLGRLLYDVGRAIMNSLWDGLKAVWGDMTGWLSSVGGWIKDLKGPIEADRVLLYDEGSAIMQGLQAGLTAGWPGVESTLTGAGDGVADIMDATGTATVSTTRSWLERLVEAFERAAQAISDLADRIAASASRTQGAAAAATAAAQAAARAEQIAAINWADGAAVGSEEDARRLALLSTPEAQAQAQDLWRQQIEATARVNGWNEQEGGRWDENGNWKVPAVSDGPMITINQTIGSVASTLAGDYAAQAAGAAVGRELAVLLRGAG